MGRLRVMSGQPANDQEKSDLLAALKVLGAGHFSNALIHRQVQVVANTDGREPMHPVRLGQVLSQYGAIRKPKWDTGKKYRRHKDGIVKAGQMVKGWLV